MVNMLTIAEAHKKLRAGDLTSTDLVQACIDQIETHDEKINAVVHKNFDQALETAKKIDTTGNFDSPLTGIPYLTKDNYCEKDIPSTACSNILRNPDYIPPFSSTTNKRLEDAGAISLAKANTDEFTMGSSTETSCFGTTKNPWDISRVAGGSSGGSTGGLAAGFSTFALGTDTCGSIRLPAAYCNLSGMRVTYGRTSRYGVMSMASSLDTIGPIARSVEDTAIILQAISGHDPLDATTSKNAVPDYSKALTGDVNGLKIGIPKEYVIEGLDQEIASAVNEAADVLKEQGAEIVDISLPHTKYSIAVYYVICPSEVSSNMARYDGIRYGHTESDPESLVDYYERVRSEGFGDEVKRRIMIGTYALSAGYYDAYYRKAQKVRTLIKRDFDEAFQQVDCILAPSTPTPAFKVGAHSGDPVAMYLEDIFMAAQPLAGIPALALPCGFTGEGLPIGFQLIGPQWGEEVLLRAGDAYQRVTDHHTKTTSL